MALRKSYKSFRFSPEELRHKHSVEGLTVRQIAEETGYSYSWISTKLREHGIIEKRVRGSNIGRIASISGATRRGRPSRLPGKEWLLEQYWGLNRNTPDLAAELGVNSSSVIRALLRHGIPIKPRPLCYRDKQRSSHDFSPGQRRRLFARDGHQCRLCGAPSSLECHHIVPPASGGSDDIDNGIVLCSSCHDKTQRNELSWVDRLLPLRGSVLSVPVQ